MLTLKINGQPLITDKKFTCHISAKSPFFLFNEIRGPLAADISVSAKYNQARLNNPNRVTKRARQNDRRFSGAELEHFGLPLIVGDYVVSSAGASIDGWMQNFAGKLGEELREKKLSELDFSELQNFVNKNNFDPDTDAWCTLRLLNRGFWKDKGTMVTDAEGNDVEELTNKFENHAGFFVNAHHPDGVVTTAGTDGVAVVSPFPFLHWLIDKIFRDNGFYMSDNFLKLDPDLKNLCLYNVFNILKNDSNYTSEDYTIVDWFSNDTRILDFKKISNSTWALQSFLLNNLLPNIDFKSLLLSAQNTFNTFFWYNNNRTVQCIDREAILKGPAFNLGKYRVSKWVPGTRKDVCLKFSWNHDNDDTAFTSEFEELDEKRHKFKEPVNTYDDLISILLPKEEGDIRLVKNENRYYEYGWFKVAALTGESVEIDKDVLGWRKASIGLQNYYFNDGDREQEEIKSDFSTLRMAQEGYPVAYQAGNSKAFAADTEPFSPRLLFYQGNNNGGNESASGKRFDWKGDAGFVHSRYKLTAPFLAGRLPIKASFSLPPRILHYVLNNIYQKMDDVECQFLIDEINCDPSDQEETLVEISAYKVEDNFWMFNPGVVPGGGDGTETTLVPQFVGVNKYGKPYTIDATGKFKTTSVFGDISTANYAHTCCVDYNSATKQLIVGGNNGYVHIYDCSDGIRMVSLQVGNYTESISCVKFANGKVLVAINGLRTYAFFNQDALDTYADVVPDIVSGALVGSTIRDFEYYNGHYYMCSALGEMHRCDAIGVNPVRLFYVDAEFTRMTQGNTLMYVFAKEDKHYSAQKTNLSSWTEFDWDNDLGATRHPITIEAKADGETVVALTTQISNNVFLIPGTNPEAHIMLSVGGYPGGVAFVNGEAFISSIALNQNSGSMWKYNGQYAEYQFELPDGLNIYTY